MRSTRYPEHIFRRMKPQRQLEVLQRFLDRLDECWSDERHTHSAGKTSAKPDDETLGLVFEIENYLGWLSQPIERPPQWSPRTLQSCLTTVDHRLGRSSNVEPLRMRRGDGHLSTVSALNLPLKIVLHNLRSAFNVGSIIRTAECLSLQEVLISGHTPSPEHPSVQKTAMGTLPSVAWQSIDDFARWCEREKAEGREVFAVETVEEAPQLFDVELPENLSLVFGNERFGLERDILSLCDGAYRLPVYGVKNSLNVANACAISGYEFLRQWRVKNVT